MRIVINQSHLRLKSHLMKMFYLILTAAHLIEIYFCNILWSAIYLVHDLVAPPQIFSRTLLYLMKISQGISP